VNPRILTIWLLRLAGTVEIAAFFAVVMPRAWMAATHSWLGLGEMPDGPVFRFVIRQASFIYATHGVLMWILASDVDRFRPLVVFTGFAYVVAGPVFFLIDWTSQTPWYWTVFDSVGCFVLGAVILGLVRWEHREAKTCDHRSRLYGRRGIGHNESRHDE
jgi:hypothetical protein